MPDKFHEKHYKKIGLKPQRKGSLMQLQISSFSYIFVKKIVQQRYYLFLYREIKHARNYLTNCFFLVNNQIINNKFRIVFIATHLSMTVECVFVLYPRSALSLSKSG